MQMIKRGFQHRLAAALWSVGLCAGCGSEATPPTREMVLHGTAQALTAPPGDGALRVVARWSTERTEHPGVFVQVAGVTVSGAEPVPFDLNVVAPPSGTLDHESDGDYRYSSAELVLLDDLSLDNGWVDSGVLNTAEVGRASQILLFVESDMPASAEGHFGIGPVDAGFHLLQRMPNDIVYDSQGRVSGAIAVWEEAPLDSAVVIELGSDGYPYPEEF